MKPENCFIDKEKLVGIYRESLQINNLLKIDASHGKS